MKKLLTLLVIVGGVLGMSLLAAPSAHGQVGALGMLREMHHRPGHFFLFDQSEEKVVDLKTEHPIQICVEQRAHKIALVVNHDGKTAKVRPGTCLIVDAKDITIKAGANLEDSKYDLAGTVEMLR